MFLLVAAAALRKSAAKNFSSSLLCRIEQTAQFNPLLMRGPVEQRGPMMNSRASRQKADQFAVGLVASYCKGCGLLIAASPRRKTLDMMETLHHCPVYFHYYQRAEPHNQGNPSSLRARLLVHLE